ncbi:MADS-box protein FBP24-like [Impatiens glandulifera]|uniref:MADS-box protein FBP24-like n=1 Tax=Impatiens glandulifera TaxID=253017 RepID=UPI001FB195FC|nr:MADS-box protein FBP24-like [Impatiens glandulifera]
MTAAAATTSDDSKSDGRRNNRGQGKKKINIARIENKSQRMVSFSKRKSSLLKNVSEFQKLTGQEVGAVVFSPAGQMYTSINDNNNNGEPSSFDVIVDRILQVGDPSTSTIQLQQDIRMRTTTTRESSDKSDNDDSAFLIGWILNAIGFDDDLVESNDLQLLASKMADLERIKEEVDSRITSS